MLYLDGRKDQVDPFSLRAPLIDKQWQKVKLVGNRCLVCASLGGIDTTVMWDTVSQVSIVGMNWRKKYVSVAE